MTELTDASGDIVKSYRYDAFASILQKSGNVQNPFTYTGREYDPETGLYYYRARYYDAEVGRFLSQDPIGYKESANLSLYTENKPVNFRDPIGLFKVYWNDDKINTCCMKKDAEAQRFEINQRILAITAYITPGGPIVEEGPLKLAGTCCAWFPWPLRKLSEAYDYYASVSFSKRFRQRGSCIQRCGKEHEAVHVAQCERDKPETYNAAIANAEDNRKYEIEAYTAEKRCLENL